MSLASSGTAATAAVSASATGRAGYRRRWRYMLFALPAMLVILAVILFPWAFTIFLSVHDWPIVGDPSFVGWGNYAQLLSDTRFIESIWRTFYFTVLAVLLPVVLGVLAAVVFHREFPLRGLLRTLFMMPMMATPVAIALVWTMMFHPQLGVLNYFLSLVGIPPQLWVFDPGTVIPSLALIEIWQWTPLVMLIVLGGLASLPTEPYESALIDGASEWQMFRHITWPLVLPFVMVAVVIRAIDALKAFDTIFVITQGGPGTASETINIFLYLQAFAFYNIGYASAVVVVFFVIIIAMTLVLLWSRQRTQWALKT
jgi:multiple sugar transport system permease protein